MERLLPYYNDSAMVQTSLTYPVPKGNADVLFFFFFCTVLSKKWFCYNACCPQRPSLKH